MFSKKTPLKPGWLYVCDSGSIPDRSIDIPVNTTVICVKDPSAPTPKTGGLLPVNTPLDLADIFNILHEAYSFFQNWDRQIHEAIISEKGWDELLRISEPLLNNPVLIYDISLHLVAYNECGHSLSDDKVASFAISEGHISAEAIKHFADDDFFGSSNDEIKVLKSYHTTNHRVMSLPFIKKGQVLGHCVVLLYNSIDETYDKLIFRNFYEHLNLYMEHTHNGGFFSGYTYEYYLTDLIDHHDEDETDLRDRAGIIDLPFEGEYFLMNIRLKKPSQAENRFLQHEIRSVYPEAYVFYYKEQLLLLADMKTADKNLCFKDQVLNLCKRILPLLKKHRLKSVVSLPFYSLKSLYHAYEQTKAVFETTTTIKKEILFFEENMIQCICSKLYNSSFGNDLIPTTLSRIWEHDNQKHTNYALILKTWLEERCRITETANRLNMHRNNIIYHLGRIESQFHVDFDNAEERLRLWLGFYMLEATGKKIC